MEIGSSSPTLKLILQMRLWTVFYQTHMCKPDYWPKSRTENSCKCESFWIIQGTRTEWNADARAVLVHRIFEVKWLQYHIRNKCNVNMCVTAVEVEIQTIIASHTPDTKQNLITAVKLRGLYYFYSSAPVALLPFELFCKSFGCHLFTIFDYISYNLAKGDKEHKIKFSINLLLPFLAP